MTLPPERIREGAYKTGRHWKHAPDEEYQQAVAESVMEGLNSPPPHPSHPPIDHPPVEPDPPIEPEPPGVDPPTDPVGRQITVRGITLTFQDPVEARQYVTGDWAIKTPCTLVSISPSGSGRHGAMWRPKAMEQQGYLREARYSASISLNYNPELNVAEQLPRTFSGNGSLIATKSLPPQSIRTLIEAAAVFTFRETLPEPFAFRPSPTGLQELFVWNDEVEPLLPKLPTAGLTDVPDADELRDRLQGPWIDHYPKFVGSGLHPTANMPNYGADIATLVGDGLCYSLLDVPWEKKRPIVQRLIQLGIDTYGITTDSEFSPRHWLMGGGHASGRLPLLVFAGLMLDEEKMSRTRELHPEHHHNESGQTFYVKETSPGVYNQDVGGYNAMHKDMAEWGMQHQQDIEDRGKPWRDDVRWGDDPAWVRYRTCCTATSWWGLAAFLHAMEREDLIEPAFLDYMKRYRTENPERGFSLGTLRLSPFALSVYDRVVG